MTRQGLLEQVRATRRIPKPAAARAIREAAGISQERIAQELGVDRVTVSRWETGARRPRGRLASAYSDLIAALADEVRRS